MKTKKEKKGETLSCLRFDPSCFIMVLAACIKSNIIIERLKIRSNNVSGHSWLIPCSFKRKLIHIKFNMEWNNIFTEFKIIQLLLFFPCGYPTKTYFLGLLKTCYVWTWDYKHNTNTKTLRALSRKKLMK